jgi:hypothetical protein
MSSTWARLIPAGSAPRSGNPGLAQTPAGQLGTPPGTTGLVPFLTSGAGGRITGQILYSSGGFRSTATRRRLGGSSPSSLGGVRQPRIVSLRLRGSLGRPASRRDGQADRDRPAAKLGDMLDSQARGDERVHQVGQRVVSHANPLAHKLARPRGLAVPACQPVAGMRPDTPFVHPLGMWAVKRHSASVRGGFP